MSGRRAREALRGHPGTRAPTLSVHARVPERDLDVAIDIPGGQVLGVLGRNGAGKSTLAALIAGLLRPHSGQIRIGDRTVAEERTWVPARDRGVALLAQHPLLFPHLDVLDNVAFAPRSTGTPRGESRALAEQILDDVDAAHLASRRPHQLSGGQAQRVALARALAADPRVLVLDEPLARLDIDSEAHMRALLRRVLTEGNRTGLLITHDLHDVAALADEVVVLEAGRIVEQGPVPQVLTKPQSPFLARLAGRDDPEERCAFCR